ncbi:MAG TPA: AbrB/MazE/SpoVT family DNA-binding domain-containing protein [Terracidiphilus sp.]|jgi:antitoxin PrlF|nr:AbrB/MazE/SpoVT family DNA-binding domain-containing protein [Terracidiphilus sp.]
MPSAMVTFNGRITLPTDVRKQLGLKTGDNIEFVEIEAGRFAICSRTAAMRDKESGVSAPALVPVAKVEETVN